ncbi:hypothetical protein P171DRAFT_484032 [Karstenula rhodostoma CBS 690.94]|uniref:Uncharacterized protein n=1 Tax=Karstenula rhodostoma CBS 690.94 TaxID=1392251 RepID=A0A9P4PLI2_9PLEO|nr:hypothetical protein P171DRAFT_484032 [Karstenula rhodostoma CBS 690.94]
MEPHTTNHIPHADESTTARTAENIASSKTTSDAPLLPHAASSASDVASKLKSAVENVASTVKTAASSVLEWTEAKAEKLTAQKEDGTGPYGSVSTCAPSDLDPIGQGVLPALPVAKKEDVGRGEGEEGER